MESHDVITSGNELRQRLDLRSAVESVEKYLRQGEPLLAYNAVQEGLQQWPGDLRLRQLKGLALARSGDIEQANRVLGELAAAGVADAETLGMLARTHKDLGLSAADATRRAAHLQSAFRLYHQAYESARERAASPDAHYTGINAATIAVLLGDTAKARDIARAVRESCEQARREMGAAADYWLAATLGEAELILGDLTQAAQHYATAATLARDRFGNLSTTRRQAQLLLAHLGGDGAWINDVLRIPPVVTFTGHMIDRPGRVTPRFPPAMEAAVYALLRTQLALLRPLAAYGSAACGVDILCLEAMRERGVETHVVLPFPPEEFRRVSVEFAGGDWGERFERALAAAQSVTITSDHRARGSGATFEYANLVLCGMGRLRSQILDTQLRGLAVWDGTPAVHPGGAASLVQLWRTQGIEFHSVQLPQQLSAGPQDVGSPDTGLLDERLAAGFDHEIRAMLFADAVGYSKLSEDQIPDFVTHVLGAVADLNSRTTHRPDYVESAGDGLYMVFGSVADAAHYALQLSELANSSDWAAYGLPAELNMRIALHCGPVYCGRNPVTGSRLYTGPHTSRTARIEPVTPPGQVYASSAFAAVAAALGVDDLAMRYVGRTPLAKGYGTLGLYHVGSQRSTRAR